MTVKPTYKVPIEDIQGKTEKCLEDFRNEHLRHVERIEENCNRKIFNLTKKVEKVR